MIQHDDEKLLNSRMLICESILLFLTLMFNGSTLWLENSDGGIFSGTADNKMEQPLSVPKRITTRRERKEPRVRGSEIKTQRKSEWRRANSFGVN